VRWSKSVDIDGLMRFLALHLETLHELGPDKNFAPRHRWP
jgi:hypothetical protein